MCLQYLFDMAGQEIERVAPFVAVTGTADANPQTKKNPHISAAQHLQGRLGFAIVRLPDETVDEIK